MISSKESKNNGHLARPDVAAGSDKVRKLIAAAQETERQRISRELHDELGQYVSTIRFGLDSLISSMPGNSRETEQLAMLKKLVDKLDKEVGHLSYSLRSPAENDGMKEILLSFVREWELRNEIPVKLSLVCPEDLQLDYDIKNAIYRVTQEALTNITRHARASHVGVLFQLTGNNAVLVIEDDGVGFDVDNAATFSRGRRHLGLAGMRERVETVGGTINIESIPGMGTVVSLRIPVPVN